MKFIVESISKCSGRLGCLTKSEKKLQTPLLLLYTKSASVPHITKEVLDMIITNDSDKSVFSNAIEISMESTLHMEDAIHAYKKGITAFAGFDPDRTLTMITIKDTGELSPSGFHEKDLVSTFTRRGKRTLSSKRYMALMDSMKPDIFHTLCDGDTNIDSSGKRVKKSIDRTESFFNECLEYYKLWTKDQISNKSMLFAPIAGGYNLGERERTINHLLQFDTDIDGYFLDGFHNNGETAMSVNQMKLKEIITHCCNNLLPNDKPKMMLGGYNPLVLLEMIQCGIDIFDNSYVYLMTNKNYALTFNFNYNSNANSNSTFHIDLSKSIYKEDFQPFLQNCNCLACKKHTRAYTNHLINTKEMLAPVLLMIHNTHHYLEFFKMIRQSIADDRLSALIELIKSQMETIDDNLNNLTNESKMMESSIEVNNSNIDDTDIEIKRIKLNTINTD